MFFLLLLDVDLSQMIGREEVVDSVPFRDGGCEACDKIDAE